MILLNRRARKQVVSTALEFARRSKNNQKLSIVAWVTHPFFQHTLTLSVYEDMLWWSQTHSHYEIDEDVWVDIEYTLDKILKKLSFFQLCKVELQVLYRAYTFEQKFNKSKNPLGT